MRPEIEEVDYHKYINKCEDILGATTYLEIFNNIPKERIYDDWDCKKLSNVECLNDSASYIVKDRRGKIFRFEKPVFNNDRSVAIILVSMATKMYGTHWLYVFEKKKKHWKRRSEIFLF